MSNNEPKSNISSRRKNARVAGDSEYERKRNAIVGAAAAVFKERGFEASSVEDIARMAGLDRASIYYYYHGKKELFREMVAGAMSGNVLMAEKIAESAARSEVKLRNLIAGLFESYETHYPYLFIYVQEDMARLVSGKSAWSKDMRSLSKRFDKAVITIIQDGLKDGSFQAKGDDRLIAAGIIGMCNWSHRWYEPRRQDRVLIAQTFSDMVLGGLLAKRHDNHS